MDLMTEKGQQPELTGKEAAGLWGFLLQDQQIA